MDGLSGGRQQEKSAPRETSARFFFAAYVWCKQPRRVPQKEADFCGLLSLIGAYIIRMQVP
ncbi:hypothetical protein CDC59_10090 [Ralstonia solanacearum]|nr:hypothetical protein CDC59_10090 [Ralstonia solanacearum]